MNGYNDSATPAGRLTAPNPIRFDYVYSPPGPGVHRPSAGETAVLLRPRPVDGAQTIATRVAEALRLTSPALLSTDTGRNISRFANANHLFEVAENSGFVRYLNRTILDGNASKEPPTRERALVLAAELVDRLEAQGQLRKTEVLWSEPSVYHRYQQEGPGGSPGEPYTAPLPPRRMDTRIKYHRVVDGTPVSGSFVMMVFTDTEQVAYLQLAWRPVTAGAPSGSASVVKSGRNEARGSFEHSLELEALPTGTTVQVLVDEFVYNDPSPFDAVNFLEPGYLFLYVVRTPKSGSFDEFIVSKKLHRFFPVTLHGETQLPSKEAARKAAEAAAHPPDQRPDRG